MHFIEENLKQVEQRIREACARSGRRREDVRLIVVSKTKPVSMIEEVIRLGIRDFGENKPQELRDKYDVLPKDLRWHMIGNLQRNKIKYVVGRAVMIHSIGVPITSAEQQASIFADANYWEAGVHAFIDSETGVVLHTLPWTQVAWHCGYEEGNGSYIGVEMCETDAGEYDEKYRFQVEDPERAKEHCRTAYYSAVKLFAELCIRFNLDPLEEGVVISHSEGHQMGIATNHGDPVNYWEDVGSGYTMDGFRQDIADYMKLFKENGWELNDNVKK